MRALIAAAFLLISFAFFALPAPSTAFADDACRCKGCGCKGGSGWRGPDGFCVSQGEARDDLRHAGRHALQAGERASHLLRQAGGSAHQSRAGFAT